MVKALIVKEDGLIYAAEVPEEPKITSTHPSFHFEENHQIQKSVADYKYTLASAKDSAILVSEQDKAQQRIIDSYLKRGDVPPFKYRGSLVIGIGEGIYPIPDLQWEVKEACAHDSMSCGCWL